MDKNGNYFQTPVKFKIDACAVLGVGKVIQNPLFKMIYSMVRKFGRIPLVCPVKKVFFYDSVINITINQFMFL
jgi:hypothetical protein